MLLVRGEEGAGLLQEQETFHLVFCSTKRNASLVRDGIPGFRFREKRERARPQMVTVSKGVGRKSQVPRGLHTPRATHPVIHRSHHVGFSRESPDTEFSGACRSQAQPPNTSSQTHKLATPAMVSGWWTNPGGCHCISTWMNLISRRLPLVGILPIHPEFSSSRRGKIQDSPS